MTGFKIGVALGGGAARGLAHIGVLEVLENAGIVPDVYAGSSMGALIAAIYLSSQKPASHLRKRMQEFLESEVFKDANLHVLRESKPDDESGFIESFTQSVRKGIMYTYSAFRESIISREVFQAIINDVIPDMKIEDLPKPFAAVSLDVASGEEKIWTRGSLRDAVFASSAIPGFFPPLITENQILVDGGWTNSVPVRPARELGADFVIAVDTSRGSEDIFEFKRGVVLILRTAQIMMKRLREMQLEEADVLVQPVVTDIHWADFVEPEMIIERGKQAALAKINEAQARIRRQRWRQRLYSALDINRFMK